MDDDKAQKVKGNVVEEEEKQENDLVDGPSGLEWGGPTRDGKYKEPTRFGDWENKGRCSDF